MRVAVERRHALDEWPDVRRARRVRGHAREAGELVHEALELIDFLDDRLGEARDSGSERKALAQRLYCD